jgi:Vault protein inter-alpha-trypsin domain
MYKETPAGLNHPDCVLQDVQIQADVYETLAKISTTHRYFNHGTANIEAVYTFPLPNSAVLLDMSLTIGDRSMTGQILPKKQAEDHYEDAVVEGDLPAMLQNPSPGIYTLNIANIKPSEVVAIVHGVQPGRRFNGPSLRRNRPGAGDQPTVCGTHGRDDSGGKHTRQGEPLYGRYFLSD